MRRRVVLVTGGSRGIGRGIVEKLLADGWTVAFTWRSHEREAREVETRSAGHAQAFSFDLRDRERPAALVAAVEEAVGPLDGLVNNAAIRKDGLLAMTSDREWDDLIDANLGGVFRMCRAAVPAMIARRRGSIVNIASLGAFHGVPGLTAYAAAKAGIVGLARSLAREVGKRGVRVNTVVPGFVRTDFTAALPEQVVATLTSGQCLPGDVSPASVAGAVSFLLSDESASITGQSVFVDAGTSA